MFCTTEKHRAVQSHCSRVVYFFKGCPEDVLFQGLFQGAMLMDSLEVRRCLVEMHAVLGDDVGFRSKEDLLELDRDHFPSDLGHSFAYEQTFNPLCTPFQ